MVLASQVSFSFLCKMGEPRCFCPIPRLIPTNIVSLAMITRQEGVLSLQAGFRGETDKGWPLTPPRFFAWRRAAPKWQV